MFLSFYFLNVYFDRILPLHESDEIKHETNSFNLQKHLPHYEKLIYETLLPVVSHLAKLYKLWKGDFKPKQKELWDIFVIFLMHRKTIKRREMSYEKNLNIFIHHSHCGKIRIFCNFCTKIQIIFLASFHHKKNF